MSLGNILLPHSKTFDIYLDSTLQCDADKDAQTKKYKSVGTWRDIEKLTDKQAAEQIRADRIDILVDLAGHTNGGRLALFTRKPAPIQCTGWGFAHSTGCPEIDYFFAYPVSVP